MLERVPTYGTTDANWSDRRWGQQVHDYYVARLRGVLVAGR
jgi:hypothetical protein